MSGGRYVMKHFGEKILGGLGVSFRYVYNVKDEYGRGRTFMLLSTIVSGLVGQVAGGLFYTSFLLQHGMDKSRIGILTFVPYLACLFNILSPLILERFKKRKAILVTGKFLYYLINIIGITILPQIVKDPTMRIVWFVILTFVASVINQFIISGFSAWNTNFLPDFVRADYFATSNCLFNAIAYVITLILSFIGDQFTGTTHEMLFLTGMRYLAFAIAIVDCVVWACQKEYPYVSTKRGKLTDVFVLPIRNKKFLYTVMVVGVYYFGSFLSQGTLNAYVLQDVGVGYTLVNGINSIYFIFFFLFSRIAIKMVDRYFWFKAFGMVVFLEALTFFAFSLVTPGKIWLYVVVRLAQHITGVLLNVILPSLQYVNLPAEDRTNYFSFYNIGQNLFCFLSVMAGTAFTGIMGEKILYMGGYPFASTQILLFASGVAGTLLAIFLFFFSGVLTPDGEGKGKRTIK